MFQVRRASSICFNSFNPNSSLTYIFVSHDLSIVRQICNRVAVMHHGRIMEFGNAEDVFNNPKHTSHTRAAQRDSISRSGSRVQTATCVGPDAGAIGAIAGAWIGFVMTNTVGETWPSRECH